MLDRSNKNVYTFYQPGIGTYISSNSMQTTSTAGRVRSWYLKAKDTAVGSNFAEHVMGGYKFLMRYYSCEDDLYFFGFSRGAYTARFLAEMLDHIGLLSAGNEELIRFAWKTYSKWASRSNDGTEEAKQQEYELYAFMRGFRETFSRPVRRIRFLGLFDTVNSVPKFESAWMQRSKFPYTARSSAKVIRHAVSIDERRAKFRQDLISGDQIQREDKVSAHIHRYNSDIANTDLHGNRLDSHRKEKEAVDRMPSHIEEPGRESSQKDNRSFLDAPEKQSDIDEKSNSHFLGLPRGLSRVKSDDSLARPNDPNSADLDERHRQESSEVTRARLRQRQYSGSNKNQDIEEVWFSGGHADIGGGWSRTSKETWMLSHVPLVWMIQEAMMAGLEFDSGYVSYI